jgi:hypothetical protein
MPAAPRPIAQKRGLRFRRRLSRQPFVLLMRCSVPLIAPLTQRIVYIITHISKNATRIAKFVDFTAFSIRLQRDKTTVFSVSILLFILVLQY